MENKIKVKIKNEEGIEIIKEVPEELLSNYLSIGWEIVKNNPKPVFEKKIDKNKDNEDL